MAKYEAKKNAQRGAIYLASGIVLAGIPYFDYLLLQHALVGAPHDHPDLGGVIGELIQIVFEFGVLIVSGFFAFSTTLSGIWCLLKAAFKS